MMHMMNRRVVVVKRGAGREEGGQAAPRVAAAVRRAGAEMADRHDFVEGTPVWVGAVAAGSGRCTWSLGRVSRVDGRRVLVETRGADGTGEEAWHDAAAPRPARRGGGGGGGGPAVCHASTVQVDNLTSLEYLNEPSILHNLFVRYRGEAVAAVIARRAAPKQSPRNFDRIDSIFW